MTTTAALVNLAAERPVSVRVVEVNRDSGIDWGERASAQSAHWRR
jgi:hypothetical protein